MLVGGSQKAVYRTGVEVPGGPIYYKVIKDIEPGEELLVHVKEGAYSLGVMAPSLDGKTLLSCGPETPPTREAMSGIPPCLTPGTVS
ncbi:PR domain zinc finger protein 16 [Cricetulus griseus]|uniref:PR domain zinc finger protein 16 n=1 Tax=Cricetulus griseus TaxID=10029 RepID=G3IM92_CRIGR|nr:PR domain zinc finger protein 16 [Cricetulus griseus]